MSINKEWHLANKLPKGAALDQRIDWHIAHSENCTCWKTPLKIQEEIEKRNKKG